MGLEPTTKLVKIEQLVVVLMTLNLQIHVSTPKYCDSRINEASLLRSICIAKILMCQPRTHIFCCCK